MKDYTICGYDIKEIQNKMLEILVEVDRVCKQYNIKYVLDSGTLLGAVRHQGFIPWDDDIDIAMLREDYDRFCEVAKTALKEKFVFETMHTCKDFSNIFGKVFDVSTKYVQKNTKHLNMPQGIFLDIFPVDNVDVSSKYRLCRIVASINTVRCIKQKTEKFEKRHILYLPLFLIPIQCLNKLADKFMRVNNKKETEYVCPICQSGTSKPSFRRTMFTNVCLANFEGKKFPIPEEYYDYLLGYYKNPMELPPEESRHPTHGIVEIKL